MNNAMLNIIIADLQRAVIPVLQQYDPALGDAALMRLTIGILIGDLKTHDDCTELIQAFAIDARLTFGNKLAVDRAQAGEGSEADNARLARYKTYAEAAEHNLDAIKNTPTDNPN